VILPGTRFRAEGASGSHLETLLPRGGCKCFNQQARSGDARGPSACIVRHALRAGAYSCQSLARAPELFVDALFEPDCWIPRVCFSIQASTIHGAILFG
jgi:hypothetical protein